MAWIVVAALNAMLAELNTVAPNRDKASDGSIGDTSHAAGASGHNPDESGNPEDYDADSIDEVRARDFDVDLNRPGLTMEMIAQYLVQQCRAGRITWIKYLIYNGRIWSASGGFATQVYTGVNKHTEHMHVSCKPDTASENTTKLLGLASLVETNMPLTPADAQLVADTLLATRYGSKAYPTRTLRDYLLDTHGQRDTLVGDQVGSAAANISPSSPLGQMKSMAAGYPSLVAQMAAMQAEDAARDAATAALVQQLLDLIRNAGGDVDSAAILSRLEELSGQIDDAAQAAGESAADAVVARFAEAEEASADALRGVQSS